MSYAIAQSQGIVAAIDGPSFLSQHDNIGGFMSRTELHSHANMVVLGYNALLIANTGNIAQLTTFIIDYKSMENVPIVDELIFL